MKKLFCRSFVFSWVWVLWGMTPEALATQVHPGAEGLYAHQIAHVFFMFSLGILVYWLRERKLVREAGWRLVQYAALFFILWNLDAVIVHYLDGRSDLFETINAGAWNESVHLIRGRKGLALFYYLAKMDHLLCVPAVILLYTGLSRLLKQAKDKQAQEARLQERPL